MVTVQKFAVKNINLSLLRQEIEASVVPQNTGLRLSGFTNVSPQQYEPFASTQVISTSTSGGITTEVTADPGQLDFRFEIALTGPEDAALDALLSTHDATQQSQEQINRQADFDAVPRMIQTYQDWDTLNASEKNNRTQELFRLMARVIDGSTNI